MSPVNPYFHITSDVKGGMEVFKSFNIKQLLVFGLLYLLVVGCSSYTPYRYSFSLIEPRNETMSAVDSDVEFRFVPSSEKIRVSIKNKTDQEINLVRNKAEYIGPKGNSRMIHYGSDYVDEVLSFEVENKIFATPLRIGPGAEMTGYVWVNNWPDGRAGQGPSTVPMVSSRIINLMTPLLPRYSYEGSVKELKGLTFNLILPIDFIEYVRDYTFTFMIDDVI